MFATKAFIGAFVSPVLPCCIFELLKNLACSNVPPLNKVVTFESPYELAAPPIVTLLLPASVVIVIAPEPSSSTKSSLDPATTLLCPLTTTVEKAFDAVAAIPDSC